MLRAVESNYYTASWKIDLITPGDMAPRNSPSARHVLPIFHASISEIYGRMKSDWGNADGDGN